MSILADNENHFKPNGSSEHARNAAIVSPIRLGIQPTNVANTSAASTTNAPLLVLPAAAPAASERTVDLTQVAALDAICDHFEHLPLTPLEDIRRYITTAYLDLIDPSAPPKPAVIRQKLLALTNKVIQDENSKMDKGELRYLSARTLTYWQVAQIMLRLRHIVRIAPSKGTPDREYEILAMYVTTGPGAGTYTPSEDEIRLVVREFMTDMNLATFREMLAVLKDDSERKHINHDRDLVAVENGIFFYGSADRVIEVDGVARKFKAKTLHAFTPDLVFLSKSHVNFFAAAQSPRITMPDGLGWEMEAWMQDLSDDEGVPELLWEVIGAIIRPHVSWGKSAWFFSVQGNNGKGTLCSLMRNLVGHGSHTSIPLSEMGKDFALEPLMRASAIIVDENDVGTYIDKAANLKVIQTSDVLQINRKFRAPVAFQFHGFMVQCLNELPRVKDKSESFNRRQLFVPFQKSFTGAERRYIKDDYLQRKEVLEYVLKRVLLDMDYYELSEPDATEVVLAEYKEANDPVRAFWQEFRSQFVWDLLPFNFIYDLHKAWFAEVSPSGTPISLSRFTTDLVQILREDKDWECPDPRKTTRPGKRLNAPEPLIAEYSLKNWLSTVYTGPDPLQRSVVTAFRPNYRGIQRRTVQLPTTATRTPEEN